MAEEATPKPPPEENLNIYGAICSMFFFIEGTPIVMGLDITRLEVFYRERIGVPIHLAAWPEIERTILARIDELKPLLKKKGRPIQARIIGPVETWFGMRLYKLLYPHVDQFLYVEGGVLVEI